MGKRVESASSINTFQQCNRKYYYQYIEKLPTSPSIHTVRGNIAHSTLEHFYALDVRGFTYEDYKKNFSTALQRLYLEQWGNYREELLSLKMNQQELSFYFEETLVMLMNWSTFFFQELQEKIQAGCSIEEAFVQISPETEVEFQSEKYSVRGFVDAIRHAGDEVHIIDYKTNAKSEIKDSIKLQLGVYSLLYEDTFGKFPDKVGVFFLKDRLYMLPVDLSLIETAKEAIMNIHLQTSNTESITDYKRNITPLCKWKNGQCDFYAVCKPHG
ncbi:PD-(D/E)XK nuclease family protein [Candidatus Woesearchaeota archaeon]|nr:PD-(D/E)XK nuclease family protein [Candidatus Woesearchaeota archaeon]